MRRAEGLASKQGKKRVLCMESVDEYGVQPFSSSDFVPDITDEASRAKAGRGFAAAINKKLDSSVQKDIFLYVLGYNVDFDYPVLSSNELQHYMGYCGAFVT